jgi:crotonobetainyl-CoA:carnitine CoA-transferase CaiB-like acyl-CoA transferase
MVDESILKDIRVLDFTWVLAGPYATRLLADFGAEVIKIQQLLPMENQSPLTRAYYNQWNRNKLNAGLNLSSVEGIELAKKLVAISDIVIENFTPRVMTNWQLDYKNLKKINPDIIMLSMSLMGQTGPKCNYNGFGATVQALSGMTRLTSFRAEKPLGPGFSYADHIAGLYASLAVLGALEHRLQTGEGQHIDLSQVETMISLLGPAVMGTSIGKEATPEGNDSPTDVPHNVYRCRDDKWIAIAVSFEEDWCRLMQAMSNPDELNNEQYGTRAKRLSNRKELDDLVGKWTYRFTAPELMALLQQYGIAAGVVQNIDDLFRDPQLKARDFFTRVDDVLIDAIPMRLSRTPAVYHRAAPITGQDNEYVFRELLGLPEEEIDRLTNKGVI